MGMTIRQMTSNPGYPLMIGGTALMGASLGGSLMPESSYSDQELLALNEMDKSSVLQEMAQSGEFSKQELIAAAQLSSDELLSYLSQSRNSFGPTGGLIGAGVGAAGGVGLANMVHHFRPPVITQARAAGV